MTAPDTASSNTKIDLKFPKDVAPFAQDLGFWYRDTALHLSGLAFKGAISPLLAVESLKRKVLQRLVQRNSKLGRPFSPFSVGGLTAGIAFGGMVFGHNGSFKIASLNISPTPSTQLNLGQEVAFTGEIMVDASKVQTLIPEHRLRDKVVSHKVTSHETLEDIAKSYSVSIDSLLYVNNLDAEAAIKPDQDLNILPVSGVLHEVKANDSVESIALAWKVPAQAIVDMNWLDEPYTVKVGQKLIIPNAEIPKPPSAKTNNSPNLALKPLNNSSSKGTGIFAFPTSGQITQYFSSYHNGIDIGSMGGAPPITAADSGRVTFAGWWAGGGGNSVWIDHGNGYVTQYAHMSSLNVSAGQSISRGQRIGIMGNTGRSFGNHLMIIILFHGQAINPLSVL